MLGVAVPERISLPGISKKSRKAGGRGSPSDVLEALALKEECDEDGEATVVAPGLVRVFSLPLLLRVQSILQRNADSSQDSANVIVR